MQVLQNDLHPQIRNLTSKNLPKARGSICSVRSNLAFMKWWGSKFCLGC